MNSELSWKVRKIGQLIGDKIYQHRRNTSTLILRFRNKIKIVKRLSDEATKRLRKKKEEEHGAKEKHKSKLI